MNVNEYAGGYDVYQNHLSIENAESYLEERADYEDKIERYEAIFNEISSIVYDDEYYKEKTFEERLNDIKEELSNA